MKKLLLLTACAIIGMKTQAQQLLIHQGSVTTAVPMSEAGDMFYLDNGNTLSVAGCSYAVNSIDSLTTTKAAYVPAQVAVNYSAQGARITVSTDIAPLLTIKNTRDSVSVTSGTDLTTEVTYHLSGSSSAASFFMDGEFKARLVLDNLNLTSPSGPAIDIACGKRIDVVVPTGTTSRLADKAGGLHKAAFFVNGHPEFEGGGTLELTGNAKHAFASDEYTLFKPDFGNFIVKKAAGDGIHVEQYLQVDGGTFNIANTLGDCIDVGVTKDATDLYNGQAFIKGGTITLQVTAEDVKGIKADADIEISGGQITASVSGLGTKGISTDKNLLVSETAGGTPTRINMTVTGTTYKPGDPLLESKCRGIKADGDFTFKGGIIAISATGAKSKAISVDGTYYYYSGKLDGCSVDAGNTVVM